MNPMPLWITQPTDCTALRSDIDLLIDTSRLFGKQIDPDQIALHAYKHHPDIRLAELRSMVLDSLGVVEPEPTVRAPWGP